MPIPVPKSTGDGNYDLGECIRFLRKERPDMASDQRIAVCLNVARKAHGKKGKK